MNATDQPWLGNAGNRSPGSFRVAVQPYDGRCVVVARGELDVATVEELRAVLTTQTRGVILDLRQVSFIDATGLRLLLEVDAAARRDGQSLNLVVGDPPPLVFEVADVAERFTYVQPPGT
jgi:anti-anti-sigma factor